MAQTRMSHTGATQTDAPQTGMTQTGATPPRLPRPSQTPGIPPLEQVRLLEERHDIYRYAHEGVAAWRILRGLFLERHASMGNPHHIPPRPLAARLRDVLAAVVHAGRDIMHLPRLTPGSPVLLHSYANRHTLEDGIRTDLLGDPLLDAVGGGVKLVAPFPPPGARVPASGPAKGGRRGTDDTRKAHGAHERNALPGQGASAGAHASRRAGGGSAMFGTGLPALATTVGMRLRAPGGDLRLLAVELARQMRRVAGEEMFTADEVAHILYCVAIQRTVYRAMLRRIGPRRVVVTNTQEWSLSAAARDLGIPVFEMQHGLFTRTHPDMLLASAAPWRDTVLPRAGFLLFGAYWKERLTGGGFYDDEVFHCVGNRVIEAARETARRTGHPATTHAMGQDMDHDMGQGACTAVGHDVNHAKGQVAGRANLPGTSPPDGARRQDGAMLPDDAQPTCGAMPQDGVMLQDGAQPTLRVLWTLSGNEVPSDFAFVGEALRTVAAKTPAVLTIRIHPRYHTPALMGQAEGIRARGLETRITTPVMRVPVHEELLRCHVHMSTFSTCHFDALGMGRPTIVLPFNGHEHVSDLVTMGDAPLAADPASLAEAILDAPPVLDAERAYRFCTAGYNENVRRALGL